MVAVLVVALVLDSVEVEEDVVVDKDVEVEEDVVVERDVEVE